jgi:transposase
MNEEELKKKIGQIEDHAREALADFPNLAKERLRMIRAIARYIRSELSQGPAALEPAADDEDPPAHRR